MARDWDMNGILRQKNSRQKDARGLLHFLIGVLIHFIFLFFLVVIFLFTDHIQNIMNLIVCVCISTWKGIYNRKPKICFSLRNPLLLRLILYILMISKQSQLNKSDTLLKLELPIEKTKKLTMVIIVARRYRALAYSFYFTGFFMMWMEKHTFHSKIWQKNKQNTG